MAHHQKELTKKQLIIVYAACALAAVIAAVCSVLLIVHLLKNPPSNVLSSNKHSIFSNLSVLSTDTTVTSPDITDENQIQKPDLVGIVDGETYYTTQFAYITGETVDKVIMNNIEIDHSFLIYGNENRTYNIKIVYTDGTTKEITVYSKEIYSLLEPLEGITESNVNADNTKTIKEIKETVQNSTLRYSERAEVSALKSVKDYCDNLLERINNTENELKKIRQAFDEATTSNLHDLNLVLEQINALNSKGNLTLEQSLELTNISIKIRELLNSTQEFE